MDKLEKEIENLQYQQAKEQVKTDAEYRRKLLKEMDLIDQDGNLSELGKLISEALYQHAKDKLD